MLFCNDVTKSWLINIKFVIAFATDEQSITVRKIIAFKLKVASQKHIAITCIINEQWVHPLELQSVHTNLAVQIMDWFQS